MTINDAADIFLQWLRDKANRWRGKGNKTKQNIRDTHNMNNKDHIQLNCAVLNPHTTLPVPLWGPLSATAASWASPSLTRGGYVLIDGPAVGDETHAQLEVSGQSAVCSQSQDQEGGEQQEAHHQQSHTASVVQKVWAVEGRPVGLHLESKGKGGREGDDWFISWGLLRKCFFPSSSHTNYIDYALSHT